MAGCTKAAEDLKAALDKVNSEDPHHKAHDIVKALKYPFRKDTITSLFGNVKSCHEALEQAMALLSVNINISAIERFYQMDNELSHVVDRTTFDPTVASIRRESQDLGKDLKLTNKLLYNDAQREKAKAIIASLAFPERHSRCHDIPRAQDGTLEWMFTSTSQPYPQVSNLVSYLEANGGTFWIQGKPASGHSTLIKYILTHHAQWARRQKALVVRHCF